MIIPFPQSTPPSARPTKPRTCRHRKNNVITFCQLAKSELTFVTCNNRFSPRGIFKGDVITVAPNITPRSTDLMVIEENGEHFSHFGCYKTSGRILGKIVRVTREF